MRICHRNAAARLKQRQSIARDHGVSIGRAQRIKAIGPRDNEVLVRFQMHAALTVSVLSTEPQRQRALPAAWQAAQNDALKRVKRIKRFVSENCWHNLVKCVDEAQR